MANSPPSSILPSRRHRNRRWRRSRKPAVRSSSLARPRRRDRGAAQLIMRVKALAVAGQRGCETFSADPYETSGARADPERPRSASSPFHPQRAPTRHPERFHGIGSRTARSKHQFLGFRQSRGTEEAHLVHARRADHLSAWNLHPAAGHRSGGVRSDFHRAAAGRAATVQYVFRRRGAAHGDLRAEHHALYFRLDHDPAPDLGHSLPRSAQEGRRSRAQDHQPIYALSDGRPRRLSGLWNCHRARRSDRRRHQSRLFLPHLDA